MMFNLETEDVLSKRIENCDEFIKRIIQQCHIWRMTALELGKQLDYSLAAKFDTYADAADIIIGIWNELDGKNG